MLFPILYKKRKEIVLGLSQFDVDLQVVKNSFLTLEESLVMTISTLRRGWRNVRKKIFKRHSTTSFPRFHTVINVRSRMRMRTNFIFKGIDLGVVIYFQDSVPVRFQKVKVHREDTRSRRAKAISLLSQEKLLYCPKRWFPLTSLTPIFTFYLHCDHLDFVLKPEIWVDCQFFRWYQFLNKQLTTQFRSFTSLSRIQYW